MKTRTLRIFWGLPIPKKLAPILVQILPVIDKVQYADTEGAIFQTIPLNDDQVQWIQDLGKEGKKAGIEIWFEEG
ncbi:MULTISPECIES: hypothetical protein [Metallosphaera]|uniref:hypothetical protein n=1 Tax=Metallosphaera TaxID=41980 RepID=UPI002989E960|nr:hypothetical protein [Metallosphaera sedula]MCP6729961.1 hypothetical protein [Metallosphaera sedula]